MHPVLQVEEHILNTAEQVATHTNLSRAVWPCYAPEGANYSWVYMCLGRLNRIAPKTWQCVKCKSKYWSAT